MRNCIYININILKAEICLYKLREYKEKIREDGDEGRMDWASRVGRGRGRGKPLRNPF